MTTTDAVRDAYQLTADLQSADPVRVDSALRYLDASWRRRRFTPLPLPRAECLAAFGEHVPDDVLARYLSVLENYADFEPTPGPLLIDAMVEAVIRYGRGRQTRTVAGALRVHDLPRAAVTRALRYATRRGLSGPDEVVALRRLVEDLLDATETRPATLEILREWAVIDYFPEILASMRQLLDDTELAALDAPDD